MFHVGGYTFIYTEIASTFINTISQTATRSVINYALRTIFYGSQFIIKDIPNTTEKSTSEGNVLICLIVSCNLLNELC